VTKQKKKKERRFLWCNTVARWLFPRLS